MTNLIYYAFDEQLIYTNPIEIDPYAALPQMATEVAPPLTSGTEVAQWQGIQWIILPERPVIPVLEPVPEPQPTPESPVIATPLAKIDFLRLFTQAERIAIKAAAKTNPIIEDYQYMLDNSNTVLLTDPDIQSGVPLLEAAGLIGLGRAVQILAGQPPE